MHRSASRQLPRGLVIAVALLAVVAAEIGTLALGGVLAPMRFLLLWCAIMLSALVGGGVGGVVAVIFSVVAALFVPIDPALELDVSQPIDLVRITLFATVALLMVWVITARDSAERRAAAVRAESSRTFRILADSAPVLVWMADASNARTFFNRVWLDFRGRALQDECGEQWIAGIHPDDVERVRAASSEAFLARERYRIEYRLHRHDGVYRWVIDSGVPRFGHAGEFEGYVGASVDITEDKEARERLQAANRAKDEFLATLSHELRTPLTVILGWAHMLRGGGLDEETREVAVETIERSAKAQQALIDELLDVSHIVRGSFVVEPKETDVCAVVRDTVDSLRASADARSVTLAVSLPAEPVVASVDAGRFRQIVWILATNAIKFNHAAGRVDVVLEATDTRLRLTVADDGSGIAPHFVSHVFDRFGQADSSFTRTHGGLGLGLSIVKDVVEMHGGSVAARSDGPDRGATFTVTLPIASGQQLLATMAAELMGR